MDRIVKGLYLSKNIGLFQNKEFLKEFFEKTPFLSFKKLTKLEISASEQPVISLTC